jgi:hypothetical protein
VNVQHKTYVYTGNSRSHQNSNKVYQAGAFRLIYLHDARCKQSQNSNEKFKENFRSYIEKTFNRATIEGSYTVLTLQYLRASQNKIIKLLYYSVTHNVS